MILCLLLGASLYSQIKIGENPQNLDASSVLELESSNRVLVITRVTDAQMLSITPLRGAMVYNTDTQCVHFYTGTEWFNPCATEGQTFSADPVNFPESTILITETVTNNPQNTNFNFEVGVINGVRNIAPSTIIGDFHITPNSITSLQLGNDSVTLDKLADGLISGQLIQWNGTEWELIEDTTFLANLGEDVTSTNNSITGTQAGASLVPMDLEVNVDGTTIEVDATNGLQIRDNGITNVKLDDDAVGTNEIIDDGVTRDDINSNIVGTGLIQAANGSLEVDNANIAPDWTNITNIPAGFADDTDDDTTYTAGTGLTLTGTTFSADNANIAPDWTNITNIPAGFADDTDDDTTYTAGTGLTLTGTTFSVNNLAGDVTGPTNATVIANGAVNSAKIADGAITNDDIAPSAAIDGSKINPVFITDVTTTGDFIDLTPDFVFEKYFDGFSNLNNDYRFRSLKEVEEFIRKNKHLPGIKSAHEIKVANEYRLTESSLGHLEKIEELFLHTIEQEKKIEELSSENQKLKEELNSLKSEVQAIKELILKENDNK